jgi:NADH:ubiquinone oxidoreductase subunit 6 (subunit J)
MLPFDWHAVLFWLMALVACGFALGVVLATNVVRMAFALVLSLAAVAGLFFLAGAQFVGAMQLMIYVGGTLVLLVFGVMLTARGPFVNMATGGGQWVVAVIIGGSLLAVLLQAALSVKDWTGPPASVAAKTNGPDSTALGMALVGVRTDQLREPNPALRAGMSGYLLAFEIISVHLVVVLVGAAFLARARRGAPETPGTSARAKQSPVPNP